MRIATWNVNSVRTRLERILRWLATYQPDVLCLQELKTTDDKFPFEEISTVGYSAAVFGQKTYNGVAILSREPMQDISTGMGDQKADPQARLISGRLGEITVICAYFPNGGAVGSDKFEYKLEWMRRIRAKLDSEFDSTQNLLLCGDSNIVYDDLDAEFPATWIDTVLCHPESRRLFSDILDWGFEDVFRTKNPDGKVYSWWDYRQLGFPRNDGLRIDHILATKPLAAHCERAVIDREERKGTKPSDHAPVVADFDLVRPR